MEENPTTPPAKEPSRGLPVWVQVAATLGTVFIGFYQINSQSREAEMARAKEEHQFQLSLQTEQTKAKEADRQRRVDELEKARAENGTAALQKALKQAELENVNQQNRFEREDKAQARLKDLIDTMLDEKHPSAEGVLALLATETGPNASNRRVVLAGLIAKASSVNSPGEARLLVDRLTEIGADAAQALIDLQRNAMEAVGRESREAIEAARSTDCDAFAARQIVSVTDRGYIRMMCNMQLNSAPPATGATPKENAKPGPGSLNVSLLLLNRTAAVLPRVLSGAGGKGFDLSGMILDRTTWVGAYPPLNFEKTYLNGADISRAVMDTATLVSLRDSSTAGVARFMPGPADFIRDMRSGIIAITMTNAQVATMFSKASAQ